jgi:hypothetical protein
VESRGKGNILGGRVKFLKILMHILKISRGHKDFIIFFFSKLPFWKNQKFGSQSRQDKDFSWKLKVDIYAMVELELLAICCAAKMRQLH